MMKRIVVGASVGWAGVVGLTWWLAHTRIEICAKASYSAAANCAVRATAARDGVLTSGLTVALVSAIFAALAWPALRTRNAGGHALIRMRLSQPSRRPVKEIVASVATSFSTNLSRTQRGLVVAAMLTIIVVSAMLGLVATDTAPPAEAGRDTPLADGEPNPFANLIPKAAATDSTVGYAGEEIAPTSDQVDTAALLDDAADELERATEQEAEPAEDEPYADIPTADAETPEPE